MPDKEERLRRLEEEFQKYLDEEPGERSVSSTDSDEPTSSSAARARDATRRDQSTECRIRCQCAERGRQRDGGGCAQYRRADKLEKFINEFKEILTSKTEKMSATDPVVAAKNEKSFSKVLDMFEDCSIEIRKQIRRYLLWNCDGIRDSSEEIIDPFRRLVEKIMPDGILLNELKLNYNDVSSQSTNHSKFKEQLSELGYTLISIAPSFKKEEKRKNDEKKKEQEKNDEEVKELVKEIKKMEVKKKVEQKKKVEEKKNVDEWNGIRGSAILVRNDKAKEYEENVESLHVGEDHGFEIVRAEDNIFHMSVLCCYTAQDLAAHKDQQKAAELLEAFKMTSCVGGGDLNMTLCNFNKYFTIMEDCLDKTWTTNSRGGAFRPSKIDFVFKLVTDRSILVKVHKPLRPDVKVNSHFPIIVDVFKNQDGVETPTFCEDKTCEFKCGNREPVRTPEQEAKLESERVKEENKKKDEERKLEKKRQQKEKTERKLEKKRQQEEKKKQKEDTPKRGGKGSPRGSKNKKK